MAHRRECKHSCPRSTERPRSAPPCLTCIYREYVADVCQIKISGPLQRAVLLDILPMLSRGVLSLTLQPSGFDRLELDLEMSVAF